MRKDAIRFMKEELTLLAPTAILLQGLLAGTAEQREQAAYGLGDLVERTDAAAFKPYTIRPSCLRFINIRAFH